MNILDNLITSVIIIAIVDYTKNNLLCLFGTLLLKKLLFLVLCRFYRHELKYENSI